MNCLHLNSEQDTWRESCVFIPKYSWTPLIRTQLFQILCYFKFKTISLGFALQSSTIDYFKLLLHYVLLNFHHEGSFKLILLGI